MPSFPNSQLNPSGAVPMWETHPSFIGAASAGLIMGASTTFVVGHAQGLNTSTPPVDICGQGTIYPFLAAAAQLKVSSLSASDTAAGTGAQTVMISGLSSAWVEISEVVTMNGITAVNTVNSYLRVNQFVVLTAGSTKSNVGVITLKLVAGGSPQGVIQIGEGISQQAVFTTPAGYVAILGAAQFAVEGAAGTKSAQMTFTANYFGTSSTIIGPKVDCISGSSFGSPALVGISVDEKVDITARVLIVGANGTDVSASFSIILLNKSIYPRVA